MTFNHSLSLITFLVCITPVHQQSFAAARSSIPLSSISWHTDSSSTTKQHTGQEWLNQIFVHDKKFIEYIEQERLKNSMVDRAYAPFYDPETQHAFEQLFKKLYAEGWEQGIGFKADVTRERALLEKKGFIFLPPATREIATMKDKPRKASDYAYNVVQHKNFPGYLIKLSKIFDNDAWWKNQLSRQEADHRNQLKELHPIFDDEAWRDNQAPLSPADSCRRGHARNLGRRAKRQRTEWLIRNHGVRQIYLVDEHIVVAPKPVPNLFAAMTISKKIDRISKTPNTFTTSCTLHNPIKFLSEACSLDLSDRNLLHLSNGTVAPVDYEPSRNTGLHSDNHEWEKCIQDPVAFIYKEPTWLMSEACECPYPPLSCGRRAAAGLVVAAGFLCWYYQQQIEKVIGNLW